MSLHRKDKENKLNNAENMLFESKESLLREKERWVAKWAVYV